MSNRIIADRRRHRLLRRQERRGGVTLNLVSMIDVFTTLVFFLLITSTSVQTVQTPRDLTLPNSVSRQAPVDTPVVIITPRDIELQGRAVMTLEDAERASGLVLQPLKAQLMQAQLMRIAGKADDASTRGEVNIMADQKTPYSLLKKVMATCGDAQFARISLSVNRHGTMVAP
jgi:biopolymer transport protein ExbD